MSGSYPFLDIAVLDKVRRRFASGDALVVLSADLAEFVWANGPGAQLWGYGDIEALVGEPSGLSVAAQRQIKALSGFPAIGADRGVSVRLSSGHTSRTIGFAASELTLPDGVPAILLAVSSPPQGRDASGIADRAIAGFSQPGHHAAITDAEGLVLAASAGFGSLEFDTSVLRELAHEVRGEEDRMIKRPVALASATLPVGFGRLSEDPERYLIVAVDEPLDEPAAGDQQRDLPAETGGSGVSSLDEAAASEPAMTGRIAGEAQVSEQQSLDETEAAPTEQTETTNSTEMLAQDNTPPAPPQVDRWYFSQENKNGGKPDAEKGDIGEPAEMSPRPLPDPDAGPVRFVWKTDEAGQFSELSEGFATSVGIKTSDILGRSFTEVADTLGLDPDGEISGLLERRDTWSGRSVHWPIAGTDLRVPVDLAALPAYGRDRSFEGFRGFGVARMGDAKVDSQTPGPHETAKAPLSEPVADASSRPEAEAAPVDETGKMEEPVRETETPAEPLKTDDIAKDRFLGEVPALELQPAPERRATDKVIRLAEHRQAPDMDAGGLSANERLAFREIADRLKKESRATPEGVDPDQEEPAQTDVVAEETETAAADPEAEKPESENVQAKPNVPSLPIRTEGFLPSAFSVLERTRGKAGVDTSILARLPVPVMIVSGETLHYANREFLKLSGYDSIGELAQNGGLPALFAEPVATDKDEDAIGRQPLMLRSKSGTETAIEANLQSVPWTGGRALLMAVKPESVDRTAQVSHAKYITDLEARVSEMSTILDTATDGIILIGEDCRIRSINRSAEALFGFESANIEEKPFTTLFAVESHRAAQDYLAGLQDNGVASVLNDGREVIGREAQGRFIPLFMTIGKLPGEGGFCAVLRDITQWKRAEEELTKARRDAEYASSQKTEFLARVSHEIRTPLNAIIGFSELMIEGRFGDIDNERYRDYLRDINRSGEHVLDLVNDLLDISKIEAGEQELNYEAVSLNDVLAESVATMQPEANRNRVIIRSSFASGLPDVVADLKTVRQIALNLLSNAVRYTQAGGQVIVSTSYESDGNVIMRIRDTGIGMSQGEIDQALKPFKQINALNRTRGDGTGLGLPLTKAMVEANRARFVMSSTEGEGTLVEIIIPSTRVLAD